jgi:hypothetical protein
MILQKSRAILLKEYRLALEHNTPGLDWFNEVFRTLGDETETGLVCMEFQDSAQSLLCYDGKIVGVVHEYPGDRIGDWANPTNEFREPLANGGNSAIIGGTETENHGILVFGIRDTLIYEMFSDPCIGKNRLTDTGGSPENYVGWVTDATP